MHTHYVHMYMQTYSIHTEGWATKLRRKKWRLTMMRSPVKHSGRCKYQSDNNNLDSCGMPIYIYISIYMICTCTYMCVYMYECMYVCIFTHVHKLFLNVKIEPASKRPFFFTDVIVVILALPSVNETKYNSFSIIILKVVMRTTLLRCVTFVVVTKGQAYHPCCTLLHLHTNPLHVSSVAPPPPPPPPPPHVIPCVPTLPTQMCHLF
jgi:hypothetical protein